MTSEEKINHAILSVFGKTMEEIESAIEKTQAKMFYLGYKRALSEINTIELNRTWISSENPPKEGGRYWCYLKYLNDGGWFSYYQWNCSYNESTNEWGDTEGSTVTHWTELLPSPK